MGRKSVSIEPERPHRLSLAELAAHDDACSDAMVDNAYFKSQIRKNRTKYNPLRGIKQDEVPQILLHKLIVEKNPAATEKDLLQLSGLRRYRNGLRGKAEQENFLQHLRKYIMMYMTDCPWEVSTTNRYTITTFEAAVTARQRVKQGQVIKYLVGTLVPLTAEESADLDLTNRNFSIVVSSRKKHSSIFLGPARFANHDCDANGRLVTRGTDGMEVIAVKNIEVGDEITVSYGDDYFGPGNMDCLCHTCERLVRNGWAGARVLSDVSRATSVLSSQGLASPGTSGSKRKRAPDDLSPLRPTKLRLKPSPSKLQHSWTPPASGESDIAEEVQAVEHDVNRSDTATVEVLKSASRLSPPTSPHSELRIRSDDELSLRQQTDETAVEMQAESEPKISKLATKLPALAAAMKPLPLPVIFGSSTVAEDDTDLDTITIKIESVETCKVETDNANTIANSDSDSPDFSLRNTAVDPSRVMSNLTTTTLSKSTPRMNEPLPSIESPPLAVTETISTTTLSVHALADTIRQPGDYLLTRKLLAQPHDRWVQCHNEPCGSYFLQPNGYQTRRECPRCERHSMLYGFSWPKTDPDPRKILERGGGSGRGRGKKNAANMRSAYKRAGRCGKGTWVEGGGDEEERVMDHRIVHRFVLAGDEKAVTRKGLLKMAEVARQRGEDTDIFTHGSAGRARRTESIGFDSDRSLTPDGEARRRSNRFVAAKVYTDV